MKNILLVARFEIQSILSKKAFWISTFLLPMLILGLSFGSRFLFSPDNGTFSSSNIPGDEESISPSTTGLVDPAGILDEDLAGETYIVYADETQALTGIEAGEIDSYFLLAEDTMQTGTVELHVEDYSPLIQMEKTARIESILVKGLVADSVLWQLLTDPLHSARIEASDAVRSSQQESDTGGQFQIAYFALFVFFMMISISSGMAMRTVSKEKENSTAEMLLVSLSPGELMTGKLLSLTAITLLQIMLWFTVILTGSRQVTSLIPEAGSLQIPPVFLAWSIPFLLAGFLMYASALTVLGVLAPSAREGTQFTLLIYLPLMIPMMLNSVFATAPESSLVVFLSLFPLTSPLSMVTRMIMVQVPAWQLAAGLAGVLITAAALLTTASRLFRSDTLLSMSALNSKRLLSEIRSAFRSKP